MWGHYKEATVKHYVQKFNYHKRSLVSRSQWELYAVTGELFIHVITLTFNSCTVSDRPQVSVCFAPTCFASGESQQIVN